MLDSLEKLGVKFGWENEGKVLVMHGTMRCSVCSRFVRPIVKRPTVSARSICGYHPPRLSDI